MIGRIPLNNLNVKIDYTFLTIPITNSAISIKLYIYKNSIFENYKKVVTH
jgi:ribosomal protein S3